MEPVDFFGLAKIAFRYLEAEGFEVRNCGDSLVEYVKGPVLIRVYLGRQSYELGLQLLHSERSFSIEEMVDACKGDGVEVSYRRFAATTPEALRTGLTQLALAFRPCAAQFTAPGAALVHAVEARRTQMRRNLEAKSLAAQIRPKAHEAFQAGNDPLAAELFERIRNELSNSEIAKLEIARTRAARR